MGNTRLLVLASKENTIDSNSVHHLREYLVNGGNCISLFQQPSNLIVLTPEESAIELPISDAAQFFVQHVIKPSGGMLISPIHVNGQSETTVRSLLPKILEHCLHVKCREESAVFQEHTSVSTITGQLVAEPFHEEAFFRKVNNSTDHNKLECNQTTFQLPDDKWPGIDGQGEKLTIRRCQSPQQQQKFNQREYFKVIFQLHFHFLLLIFLILFEQALKTNVIGRTCLYFDVISSTQSVLERCPSILMANGSAVFARRQTRGRGDLN